MDIESNKKLILKGDMKGSSKANDMKVVEVAGWSELPEGSSVMVVKNLYLSCDPYMRLSMVEQEPGDSYLSGQVRLLKEKFGFDEAFNYKKESDFNVVLKRCLPSGKDVYFDNVGSAMLDAVLLNMNDYGRIAACGMISRYNLDEFDGVRNLIHIVTKRLRVEGYIIFDHVHPDRYHSFEAAMATLIREGKVTSVEDIVEGVENGPAALAGLFSGRNVGKQLVLVARE